jgi:hypothetical protein
MPIYISIFLLRIRGVVHSSALALCTPGHSDEMLLTIETAYQSCLPLPFVALYAVHQLYAPLPPYRQEWNVSSLQAVPAPTYRICTIILFAQWEFIRKYDQQAITYILHHDQSPIIPIPSHQGHTIDSCISSRTYC